LPTRRTDARNGPENRRWMSAMNLPAAHGRVKAIGLVA